MDSDEDERATGGICRDSTLDDTQNEDIENDENDEEKVECGESGESSSEDDDDDDDDDDDEEMEAQTKIESTEDEEATYSKKKKSVKNQIASPAPRLKEKPASPTPSSSSDMPDGDNYRKMMEKIISQGDKGDGSKKGMPKKPVADPLLETRKQQRTFRTTISFSGSVSELSASKMSIQPLFTPEQIAGEIGAGKMVIIDDIKLVGSRNQFPMKMMVKFNGIKCNSPATRILRTDNEEGYIMLHSGTLQTCMTEYPTPVSLFKESIETMSPIVRFFEKYPRMSPDNLSKGIQYMNDKAFLEPKHAVLELINRYQAGKKQPKVPIVEDHATVDKPVCEKFYGILKTSMEQDLPFLRPPDVTVELCRYDVREVVGEETTGSTKKKNRAAEWQIKNEVYQNVAKPRYEERATNTYFAEIDLLVTTRAI
jgi:hypothetical protein